MVLLCVPVYIVISYLNGLPGFLTWQFIFDQIFSAIKTSFSVDDSFYVESKLFPLPYFRGNPNVTLTLSWNIIPNAGLLPSIFALGKHAFHFPSEYTTSRV
jgi:hypothetical protein